jgi:hypothetical protein
MKKFGVLIVTSLTLFIGVVIFSFSITQSLSKYRLKKEEIVEVLNFKERVTTAWEWVPGNSIGDEKVAIWQKLEASARSFYADAVLTSILLAVFILLFVAVNIFASYKKEHNYRVYGFVMIFCSISFLFLALQSPFLEVMAYNKDLTFTVPIDVDFDEMDFIGGLGLGDFQYDYEEVFEGRVYYFYQNKSVLELIQLLYTGGNFAVAILVVFVTILFPFFKFIASLIILASPHKPSSLKLYRVIHNLAKWSMIDVFTAGLFLAYFAYSNMNLGVETGAETLIGLYYFLVFVVLSINSGQYLKKAMKRAQGIPEGLLEVGFEVPKGAL